MSETALACKGWASEGRAQVRSADFQSAVSQICNLRSDEPIRSLGRFRTCATADWKSALRLRCASCLGLSLLAMLALQVFPAAAQSTNNTNSAGPRRLDFSSFRVVPDRNIFNQHRYARRTNEGPRR